MSKDVEWVRELALRISGGRALQAEGMAKAKLLRLSVPSLYKEQ